MPPKRKRRTDGERLDFYSAHPEAVKPWLRGMGLGWVNQIGPMSDRNWHSTLRPAIDAAMNADAAMSKRGK